MRTRHWMMVALLGEGFLNRRRERVPLDVVEESIESAARFEEAAEELAARRAAARVELIDAPAAEASEGSGSFS